MNFRRKNPLIVWENDISFSSSAVCGEIIFPSTESLISEIT